MFSKFCLITTYKTDNGGKKLSITGKYFNCIAVINGINHDCRIVNDQLGEIKPGDEVKRAIDFVDDDLRPVLVENQHFKLRELMFFAEVRLLGEAPK